MGDGHSENQRYPSLPYNSLTEKVIVVTCPNSLHDEAASEINAEILADITTYVSTYSPQSEQLETARRRIHLYNDQLMIVIEVEFSKSYETPRRDKDDMWIDNHAVKVVVLVYLR
ncbi:hypothetical protein V1527DRAFT_484335 [Lipomyces starkeyi]